MQQSVAGRWPRPSGTRGGKPPRSESEPYPPTPISNPDPNFDLKPNLTLALTQPLIRYTCMPGEYPTNDVVVAESPALRSWLNEKLRSSIWPLLAAQFGMTPGKTQPQP